MLVINVRILMLIADSYRLTEFKGKKNQVFKMNFEKKNLILLVWI